MDQMRDFAEVRNEFNLKRAVESPLGTVYSMASKLGPFVCVRHFDRELGPEFVPAYVDLTQAAHDWIESHPELKALVRIELPVEAGLDFVMRRWHVYYTSTSSYMWDEPWAPEPPPELEPMRAAFRAAVGKSGRPQDELLETILSRSLLEPSGKTYESESGFVVVELKPLPEEVKQWARLRSLIED
jgi:hypothetical protein